MNDLFKELKSNYINYNSNLEKVNKLIEVCYNIQKSVLGIYDNYNSNYSENFLYKSNNQRKLNIQKKKILKKWPF